MAIPADLLCAWIRQREIRAMVGLHRAHDGLWISLYIFILLTQRFTGKNTSRKNFRGAIARTPDRLPPWTRHCSVDCRFVIVL